MVCSVPLIVVARLAAREPRRTSERLGDHLFPKKKPRRGRLVGASLDHGGNAQGWAAAICIWFASRENQASDRRRKAPR